MKRLLLLACFAFLSILVQAQTQTMYERLYKKAHSFRKTNYDSCSFYMQKAIKQANGKKEKYKAYFVLASSARRACYYKSALQNFQNAQKYFADSIDYINTNIHIATIYFSTNDYTKTKQLNTQNITYLEKKKSFTSLCYAYNLRGRILLEEKSEAALPVLRKALRLRQAYKKRSVGNGYESLAQAFFRFRQYDSAAFYQAQIVLHHLSPSPSEQAYQQATLAKYLVFAGKHQAAQPWLAKAESIKKTLIESQLFVAHARSLWLQASQHAKQALVSFARCDSLITAARQSKQSIVEKRAINQKAIRIYKDILQAKLPAVIREKYEAKLDAAQAWYHSYSTELKLKDEQRINKMFAPPANKQASFFPIYLGFASIGLSILFLLYYHMLPQQRYLRQEKKLLKTLETRMSRTLTKSEQQLVIMILKGSSFKDLAESFRTTKDTMKYQTKKLAISAKLESLHSFVDEFRYRYQKNMLKFPWGKPTQK